MNVLSLRTQARLKAGLTSTDYSDANLLTQFNEGYFKLASIMAQLNEDYFEEQKVKFNLVANSSLYSQPTDAMKIKQVRLAYTTPTSPADYRIARSYDPSQVYNISVDEESVSTSNPIVDITNNYYRIKPTPVSSVTSGGELYYIARPSALVLTGDTPIIPTEYHDLISTYGAKEMCLKFSMFDKWKLLEDSWLKGIERVKTDLSERNLNSTPRMRNPLEDSITNSVRELW